MSSISLASALDAAPAENSGGPLAPPDERASFHLADDQLRVELVAAEPDVVSPVAIAWDADGRMFVAEMTDYPAGPTAGRIKLLEDRDGDGRYERATVFADKLSFPNGVLPWNGGVLVTAAPDILFLKDTDGDGCADERRVLFTGFGKGNQQLRVNGLFWGLDNWIYGANGRSDGDIRRPEDSPGKAISIRRRDFRFRPDTAQFEAIAGQSQFGMGHDDWGNRFLSWNTIPIRHEVLPDRYLSRNPHLAATETVADLLEPDDTRQVFPLTPPPLTFNNESTSHFNALAGLTVYRGNALGEDYHGNAFVGESLRNLVHRRVLRPGGPTFVARRSEQGKEFLASTDPWFHPVNFATGPDGALYVIDFYRRFVEHPDFVPQKLRGEVPWRTGAEHGRIWRIQNSKFRIQNVQPRLSRVKAVELVKCLEHSNGWWRDTAQRLLVEQGGQKAVSSLTQTARRSQMPEARLHALCTLDGLGALTPELLAQALKDVHPAVREHAVRLSEQACTSSAGISLSSSNELRRAIFALVNDTDARVRLQLALSLGEFQDSGRLESLSRLARKDCSDRWHTLAILSSAGPKPWLFLKQLLQEDPAWLNPPTASECRFLDQAARLVGAGSDENEIADCFSTVVQSGKLGTAGQIATLAGLADGLAQSQRPLHQLLRTPPPGLQESSPAPGALWSSALSMAGSSRQPTSDRLVAIRLLAQVRPPSTGQVLLQQLNPEQPAEVQAAAAGAVIALEDKQLAKELLAGWGKYTTATRRQVMAATPRSPAAVAALMAALEQGQIQPVEVDASSRQALLSTRNLEVKSRLESILRTPAASDREEVVRRYEPALKVEGNRRHGAECFARTCMTCHAIQGHGQHVGPDLSGVASRPKEALLADILDPSRQVSPDFISYSLVTTQGETLTGLIGAETGSGVTLRRANLPDETILRSQIKELRAEGKSLMPDGLEQGLSEQDMADLLAFLRQPDPTLIPREK